MWLKRVSADDVGPSGPTYLSVWFFFHIAAGHVALPLLILTIAAANKVKKRTQVINVLVTWILSSVIWCLLLYAGQHEGPEPSKHLCEAQASLIGAIPILTTTAAFNLAFYLRRLSRDPDFTGEFGTRSDKAVTIWRIIIPYIAFGVFVAIGASLAVKHPERVSRAQSYFYCSLDWKPLSYATDVIATVTCLAALALVAPTTSRVLRSRRTEKDDAPIVHESLGFSVRVLAFITYLSGVTVVNLAALWTTQMGVTPDLLHASVGMAAFLIFSADIHILHAWRFWRWSLGRHDRHVLSRSAHTSPTHSALDPIAALPHAPFRVDGDRSSNATGSTSTMALKDLADKALGPAPGPGPGVQIIGRPEEAFTRIPVRAKRREKEKGKSVGWGMSIGMGKGRSKRRDTISTWGFDTSHNMSLDA